MRLFIALVLWCLLFVVCWPLALLVLVAFPVIWVLSIPVRVVVFVVEGVLGMTRGLLMLPARMLMPKSKSLGAG